MITRALSIRSPYAEEIMAGSKQVEYRTWRPRVAPGRIAVHRSGKGGAIIGTVEVYEITGHDGDWEWHLRAPRPCEPIPIKGRLNLWHLPEGIELD